LKHFKKVFKGLMARFFITYLLVILFPTLLICNLLYTDNLKQSHFVYINTKRESLVSDQNYIENNFLYIEEKVNLFNNAAGLTELFDENLSKEEDVVYTFLKDVAPITKLSQLNNPYIKQLKFYTSNKTAVRVLPLFLSLDSLYNENISEQFKNDPSKELFKHFWRVENVNDELQLTYYAGLMNSQISKVNGALSITCNSSLLKLFLNENSPNTATYIYWNGQYIYSYQNNDVFSNYLNSVKKSLISNKNDTYVFLDEKNGILQSSIYLKKQNINIIQLSKLPEGSFNTSLFSSNILLFVMVFLFSNIIMFLLVFYPLHNVSSLARHMRQTHSPKLLPYSGKITNDEVGELIVEYNSLVERTIEMSETLHRNELLLKNAQIETLQSQLNPHFFYGTLESIRMIAEYHNETLIAEIAYAFGNLMRYSLSREYFVSIENEIEIVKQYTEIQQKRLGDRFSIRWDIDFSVNDWKCPKFVLFSMIENVIVHDVEHSRKKVNIDVNICQIGNDLSITVANDGPGISHDRLESILYLRDHPEERKNMSSRNNGRSIFNINDRLKLYYGNDYQFNITSQENVLTVCNVRFNIEPKNQA
jgi:two-component system sensor histidine kinase YesM